MERKERPGKLLANAVHKLSGTPKWRKRLSVYYKQLRTICSVLQSIRYLTLLYLILAKIGREVAIFCMAKFHFQLI